MRLNTVEILGVNINSTRFPQLLNELTGFVAKPRLKDEKQPSVLVFTPNPEFLVEATRDECFRELLNQADINLPDGVGLVWAGRFLGTPILERVSGADIVEKLLKMTNDQLPMTNSGQRWVAGIVGARRGVMVESNELVNRLQQKYPNITFVNLDESSVIARSEATKQSQRLPRGKAPRNDMFQIVLACQGMKKQEQWIWENARPSSAKASAGAVKANVFMGVGGSLDFLTGFTKRAPKIMRFVGFEWLWRGLQKPGHFKRVWKAVFVFGWLVLREKIRNLKH